MTWYNNISSDATDEIGNWQKPDFGGYHYGYMHCLTEFNQKTQVAIFYSGQSAVDKANAESIETELAEYIEDGSIIETYAGNDAILIVTAIDKNGNETPAWHAVVDIARALSDYPVLDDMLLAQYEMEGEY